MDLGWNFGEKEDKPEEQDDSKEIQGDLNLTTSTSIELQPEKMSLIELLAKIKRNKQEQLSRAQIARKQPLIELLAKIKGNKQEQPSLAQITRKQSASSIPTAEDKNLDQIHTNEQYEKRHSKYNQFIKISNHQHDESPSYYNECISRLSVYDELNTKSIQLKIDNKSLQSSIQQKNEPDLQSQNELNNYQDSLSYEKKNFEEGDLLHSTLTELDIKIQQLVDIKIQQLVDNEIIHMKKQLELEREIKLLEQLKDSHQKQNQIIQQLKTSGEQSKQTLATKSGTSTRFESM